MTCRLDSQLFFAKSFLWSLRNFWHFGNPELHKRMIQAEQRMDVASSYTEWRTYAQYLDHLEGSAVYNP